MRTIMVRSGLAAPLLHLGLLGLDETRRRLAMHYLSTAEHGIEIGALHYPLPLPRGTRALYVDLHGPAELKRLSQESAEAIVAPDVIADGFSLRCIAQTSQSFVIANHVLEHATDALGTLLNWLGVLRPGGILFVAVPRGERCFDRGRIVTPASHFLDDHRLTTSGDSAAMRARNRAHVEEHLAIAAPAIAGSQGLVWNPPEPHEREKLVLRLLDRDPEQIHHHVFSQASFRALLDLLTEASDGRCRIERVARSSVEIVGIVRRLA